MKAVHKNFKAGDLVAVTYNVSLHKNASYAEVVAVEKRFYSKEMHLPEGDKVGDRYGDLVKVEYLVSTGSIGFKRSSKFCYYDELWLVPADERIAFEKKKLAQIAKNLVAYRKNNIKPKTKVKK